MGVKRQSAMVSVAVSKLGASNIHVLDPGVKINGAYYRDVVLRQMLLPDIRAASGSVFRFSAGQCPNTSCQRHSSAGLYLTEKEQDKLAQFFETRCIRDYKGGYLGGFW